MQETTLCYIEHAGNYLMLLRNKKQNDLNEGKWIGVGGKLEPNETPEQCALREIREETGLTALDLTARGVVHFDSDAWGSEIMHLYTVTRFEGQLTDCDEGELRWIDKSEIFDLHLWDGDRVFLQYLIDGAPYFDMTLHYDKNDNLQTCVVNGCEQELFDIYNEDGTPAHYIATRDFAHLKGLWHITAHIWVARTAPGGGTELLLQLRSQDKDLYPGFYDTSSAGHIAAGEDIFTGAQRELEEELGITAAANELQSLGQLKNTYDNGNYHDREHCHVFLYRGHIADDDIHCQESEVDGVRWLRFEECIRAVETQSFPICIDLQEMALLEKELLAGECSSPCHFL